MAEDGKASQTVILRYERLLEFCNAYGRLGHTLRHCNDGSANKDKLAFGPWLKAAKTMEFRRMRRGGSQREGYEAVSSSNQGKNALLHKEEVNQTVGTGKDQNRQAVPNQDEGGMNEGKDVEMVNSNQILRSEEAYEIKSRMEEQRKGEDRMMTTKLKEKMETNNQNSKGKGGVKSPAKTRTEELRESKRRARANMQRKGQEIETADTEMRTEELLGKKRCERGGEGGEDTNAKQKLICIRTGSQQYDGITAVAMEQPRRSP